MRSAGKIPDNRPNKFIVKTEIIKEAKVTSLTRLSFVTSNLLKNGSAKKENKTASENAKKHNNIDS